MEAPKLTPRANPGDPTVRWLEHEFRCLARENGWLTIRIGVEEFFSERDGARRIITGEFSFSHLHLRSLPDMAVRSPAGTHLIEAKSAASDTRNVAVELWQLLQFRRCGGRIWYLFGWPDVRSGQMDGCMVYAQNIVPRRIHWPSRIDREWPVGLQEMLRRWIDDEGWTPLVETRHAPNGSGDPYALFPKRDMESWTPVRSWLKKYGGGGYGDSDKRVRIAWEGTASANRTWSHVPIDRIRKVSW